MHERKIMSGDATTSLIEAGVGGRPLMLVHGFTGAKEDFGWLHGGEQFAFLDRFAELGWHAVAPDLYGHGSSTHFDSEEGYSLEAYVAQIEAIADSLGWTEFVLLGHSMGGMIVQEFVLTRPGRVAALILMNTSHSNVTHVDPVLVPTIKQVATEHGTAGILAFQQAITVRPVGADYAHSLALEAIDGYATFASSKLLASSGVMFSAMAEILAMKQRQRLELLANLSMPTMVMVGDLDDNFLAASAQMASVISGVTYSVINGGGHCPQFEAPSAWWDAMTGFLSGLAPK